MKKIIGCENWASGYFSNFTMVRAKNLVMAPIDLGVNWYLQFLFRLMAKLLQVILSLKLEVRLTKVVRDSLWRHRGAKGTNMVRFRVKFITSKLNFIKKLNWQCEATSTLWYPFNFHTHGPFLSHIVSIHTKIMSHSISIQWSLPFPYYFAANPSISIQTVK